MKKNTLTLLSFIAGVISLSAQTNENPDGILKGLYLGQEPPGLESKVFALGFISTDAGELNSVFCCDGNEFYFSRRGIQGKPSVLMVSKRIDDSWSDPEQLEFSGVYNDIDLFVTADGQSMIFCSRRPHISGESEKADHDFWISKRDGDDWLEPVLFAAEAISEYEDFYPVLTGAGNLYFNSQRGGQQGNNIYLARIQDGKYTEAAMLPEPINSDSWEFDAYITPDEEMILFSSLRPGGYGGADIYISLMQADGNWSTPKNLGPEVNSVNHEYGASFSPDGKYLFFTSTRNGSEDIFWISTDILSDETASTTPGEIVKSSGEIFMSYFIKHWDDIHDVIMRFHYDDPTLKGLVTINMTWRQGILSDAEILENTTGNTTYGLALIDAMEDWVIPEIKDAWSSAIPIRTAIKGSTDPGFNECGILTGKITDEKGVELPGVPLVIQAMDGKDVRSDTLYSNREGVFIQTLVPPGRWQIRCSKTGYKPISLENIEIKKGQHHKQDINLEPVSKENFKN